MPLSATLLPTPAVCPKAENLPPKPTKVLSGLIGETIDMHYLEVIGPYTVILCVTGLALQLVASWHSGHRSPLISWGVLFGIEIFEQFQTGVETSAELFQIVKVCFLPF